MKAPSTLQIVEKNTLHSAYEYWDTFPTFKCQTFFFILQKWEYLFVGAKNISISPLVEKFPLFFNSSPNRHFHLGTVPKKMWIDSVPKGGYRVVRNYIFFAFTFSSSRYWNDPRAFSFFPAAMSTEMEPSKSIWRSSIFSSVDWAPVHLVFCIGWKIVFVFSFTIFEDHNASPGRKSFFTAV